jgi:hypothetical protein
VHLFARCPRFPPTGRPGVARGDCLPCVRSRPAHRLGPLCCSALCARGARAARTALLGQTPRAGFSRVPGWLSAWLELLLVVVLPSYTGPWVSPQVAPISACMACFGEFGQVGPGCWGRAKDRSHIPSGLGPAGSPFSALRPCGCPYGVALLSFVACLGVCDCGCVSLWTGELHDCLALFWRACVRLRKSAFGRRRGAGPGLRARVVAAASG